MCIECDSAIRKGGTGDMKKQVGDIWKDGRKWKLQAPKGVNTLNTKKLAIQVAITFTGYYKLIDNKKMKEEA